MHITEATTHDLDHVLAVERAAFGQEEEATLTAELLGDASAQPSLSLLAWDGERPIGHILFTAARIEGAGEGISVALLAPLAVVPEAQRQGVGGALIEHGLAELRRRGVALVFVLGHPEYYPRHGFEPAGVQGLDAPYPIPEELAGAWMVQALQPGVLGEVRGTVICADALSKPEYWRE